MKLTGRVTIKSIGTWLPEGRARAAKAVSEGALDARDAENMGVEEVPVAEDGATAPDMAVRAARSALEAAGLRAREIDVLCHAWVYHQGYDLWSPSHYIANELGAASAFPYGVQAMSNGGAVAFQAVISHLLSDPELNLGLVTTADTFVEPGILRWTSSGSVAYGDGATATLIGRPDSTPDLYRLLSIAGSTASELEGMYRIGLEPTPAPLWNHQPISMRAGKNEFFQKIGIERFREIASTNVFAALSRCLDDAGLEADDPRIRACTLPRVGNRLVDLIYMPVLAKHLKKVELVQLNAHTGHLGAGDMFANLKDVLDDGLLRPGDIAISLGGGGGFTWSCTIVEVPQADW